MFDTSTDDGYSRVLPKFVACGVDERSDSYKGPCGQVLVAVLNHPDLLRFEIF